MSRYVESKIDHNQMDFIFIIAKLEVFYTLYFTVPFAI